MTALISNQSREAEHATCGTHVPSRVIAIILASGTGSRFGSRTPKQFLKLAGKTVLEHTIDVFERHSQIDEILIVTNAESLLLTNDLIIRAGYRKTGKVIVGGDTRQASSAAGITALPGERDKILVHDAVRPLVDAATISRCIDALDDCDAVDTAIPASDTIIQINDDDAVRAIPDRSGLRLGQTPQAFRSWLLRQAHQLAAGDATLKVTDDCGLIVHYALGQVRVVAGDVNNIKITYPSDIYLADRLFQLRSRMTERASAPLPQMVGKTIVIFGASRGIGASIAEIAEKSGAHVFRASRSDGTDIAKECQVRSILAKAKQTHGRIDLVVATAGVLHTGLVSAQDYALIDEQLSTNLRGSVVVAREAFEAMRDTGGGSIALFTSSSYTRGRAMYSIYSATKAAVVNLMQSLSEEFLPFNVRINAINPERTATPMRSENFGIEPADSLLDAETVARATLTAAFSRATGEVIDVRRGKLA